MITVKVLTPEDWALWRELRLAALGEAPHAFGSRLADWQGDGDCEDRWRARLELPGAHNLSAMLDDRPAGLASGVPDDSRHAADGARELISMWTAPEARGHGVAGVLIRSVEDWARASGGSELRLAVAEGNEPALALYRRLGFTETGRRDKMPDGERYEIVMAKPLRAR